MSTELAESSKLPSAWRLFSRTPLVFLVAQLPQLPLEWLDHAVGISRMQSTPSTLPLQIGYFVVVYVVGILSAVATFAMVCALLQGERPHLGRAWTAVLERFSSLLYTSVILTGVLALGIAAFAVPALFLYAAYLFVPYLTFQDPKRPASIYFFRSFNIAKKQKLKNLGVTLLLILLTVAIYASDSGLESLADRLRGREIIGFDWVILTMRAIQGCVSTTIGALFNVFLAWFFLHSSRGMHETNG